MNHLKLFVAASIIALIVGCTSTPSGTPMNPDDFRYVRVATTGKDQKEGYATTLNWFADTFVSATSVLQINDPDTGLLVGKSWFRQPDNPFGAQVHFTVKIETKDARARISFYDIYLQVTVGGITTATDLPSTVETHEAAQHYFDPLLDAFEKYVIQDEDDW